MQQAKKKVSVVVPLYNREQTILRALESVLTQSYPVFEVIVVDDCSSDGSVGVVEALGDSRVKLFRHDNNRGAAAARNTGVKAAKGEYIAFQDSDDLWLPGKLKQQMERFSVLEKQSSEEGQVGLVYCAFHRYRGESRELIPGSEFRGLPKEGAILKSILLKNFITTQAVVARKSCLEAAGLFDEKMPRFHDWELWLRMASICNFAYADRPLVDVYFSENSISAEQESLTEALGYIIDKHYDLYARTGKNYLSGIIFSYGHNLCLGENMRKGRVEIIKAIKSCPSSMHNWLALLSSLGGYRFYRWLYSLSRRGA